MKLLALFFFIAFALATISATGDGSSEGRCRPGSSFRMDCNNCICSDDGNSAICTMMACPPRRPWGPLYVPGTPCPAKNFYSECNQCVCGEDGRSAACTLMLCDAFRP